MSLIHRLYASLLVAFALASAGHECLADDATPQKRPAGDVTEAQPEILSPLHTFLGIDPATGEFVPVAEQTASAVGGTTSDGTEVAGPAAGSGTSDSIRNAIATQEPVRRVIRELNEGGLTELSSLLDGTMNNQALTTLRRQVAVFSAALMLLFPLGIVVSELAGWWGRKDEDGLTDLDRRYYRTRLRRQLLLAALVTVLIGLCSAGSLTGYWWSQPAWFTAFCGATALIGVWSLALWYLVRHSARNYSVALMRDVRRYQLELRQDLDELRKRMGGIRLTQQK